MIRSVGIDLGIRTTHEVVAWDPGTPKPQVRFRCGHSLSDLERMLQLVQQGLPSDAQLQFVMEPTGTAWVPLTSFLQQRGYPVYLVKGEMVKDQRKVLKKHVKTDQIDALTLAKLPWIASGALNPVGTLNAKQRTLLRRKQQLTNMAQALTRKKLQIKALVDAALPVGLEQLNLFSEVGQLLCKQYLNPARVKRLGRRRLAQVLQNHVGHRAGNAAEIWYLACIEANRLLGDETAVDFDAIQDEVRMFFEILNVKQTQHDRLALQINQLYVELHPTRNLETIPGVGPALAAASVAAIQDATRFANSRKFRAYTGMIPQVSASGQRQTKGSSISKAGPNWLKRLLYMGANTARRHDPELAKIYYDQMVKHGKHHFQAMCAVAAHLADRIFVVLRDDRPYELRDLDGNPISPEEAKQFIADNLTVPEEVRRNRRSKNKGKHRPQNVRAS